MAVKFALHEIHHTVGGERKVQAPGEVFEVADSDVAFFEKVGAVRDPDDRELTCYKAATGQLVAATPAPVPSSSKGSAAPAADEGKGDEDAIG